MVSDEDEDGKSLMTMVQMGFPRDEHRAGLPLREVLRGS